MEVKNSIYNIYLFRVEEGYKMEVKNSIYNIYLFRVEEKIQDGGQEGWPREILQERGYQVQNS